MHRTLDAQWLVFHGWVWPGWDDWARVPGGICSRTRGASATLTVREVPVDDKPTLVSELVTLRPIRADDADTIDRLIRNDDEIARPTGSVHRSTEKPEGMPIEDLCEIYGSWAVADHRLVLGVLDNASGDVVGEMVLNESNAANRSCGFRTLIVHARRGRGLGTEARRLIVRHGLGAMGPHRIALEVFAFNPRARHVYEMLGFVHEGTGRDALLFDDRWVDVHFMAMLSDPGSPA